VTNDGDIVLTSVTVTDNPATTITFNTTTFLGLAFPANGGGVLSNGDSVGYSGSYTPPGIGAALCGPFTDTATATGRDSSTDPDFIPQSVTNTATATCHVLTSPGIALTKDCFKDGSPGTRTLNVGDKYTVVFAVANTGNVALQNVVIHDDVLGDI